MSGTSFNNLPGHKFSDVNAPGVEVPTAGPASPGRRDFLRYSAAVGGGLLIGITLDACSDKPAELAASGVPTAPSIQQNAWLAIATDGEITFYSGQSEMGQGVYTALPTLLAEELEVPVSSVQVVAGPAGEQFINDLLGTQVTGGSTSVRDAWVKLRTAGAEARLRLVQAAADRWGVPVTQLKAENGTVINADGAQLGYGELAEAAAQLPRPENISLKPNSTFRQIGKPQHRLDSVAKTNGTAEYGIDVRRPEQVYGAIVMCPVLGGTLASVDITAARSVYAVIDIVQLETAVVVVANTWWQASQARELLDITWNTSGHEETDNAQIFAGLKQAAETNMGAAQVARSDGAVDAALDAATERMEAVYTLPLLAHATMEPMNCTAEFEGDELHIYVPTQVQIMAQGAAAAAAGIAPEQVHVHTTFLGGGFGRRLEVDFIPAAVKAAQQVGRPVQLLWDREDDMTHDIYRPPARDLCSAGFDSKGKLTAWKLDLVGPSITARWAPAVVAKMIDPFAIEAAANYPYAVENVQVRYLRHEVGFDVGFWRSVSHATNCFVAESFMDEIAQKVGAKTGEDSYQYRRSLLKQQPLWRNVLELAASKAGWGQPAKGRFQGIALMEGYNTYMAQVAEVSIDADSGHVTVHKITCAADCGQVINPGIVDAQIQGAIIFGLSAALWGEINIEAGVVQESNFDNMRILRINEIPDIDIHIVDSNRDPGGMGEPATALVAPAVCNAIYAATGKRLRSLPLSRHGMS
ncbi:MAG: xanthine dehydrogenase family protein molybdopterin-binding subunit [Gammaproteobacteria bacterium]|nr:MAG: xanthine dehydrogenase family protein molybdopterin-binding subunit [Gammaproteobacteria bacterium]